MLKFKKKYTVEEFVEKYEEVASIYPQYFINDNPISKKIMEKKVKKHVELNKILKLNDEFAHEVIDILMESKNPVIICEISRISLCIGYKEKESKNLILKNLKKINNPPYVCYTEFFISKHS